MQHQNDIELHNDLITAFADFCKILEKNPGNLLIGNRTVVRAESIPIENDFHLQSAERLVRPYRFNKTYPQQLSTAGDKPVDKDPAVGRVAVADKAGGGGLPSSAPSHTPYCLT